MEKHRAIPSGYMTVGEVSKKMDVTVRTLQHYDKEGLLIPSCISEGGRRLYTDKDIVKLHQILSLKHLGFSLDDIKNRLISLDTPTEVAAVLQEQATAVQNQIKRLTQSLKELEVLRQEVLQMQTVDFKKYADIIVNLQMGNEFYWLIKHFDEPTLDHIRSNFDKESGAAFMNRFSKLQEEAIQLKTSGIGVESEQGQAFAESYWNLITEFTGGDMQILAKLMEMAQFEHTDSTGKEKQQLANSYIEKALGHYLSQLGINL